MKKFLASILKKVLNKVEKESSHPIEVINKEPPKKIKTKKLTKVESTPQNQDKVPKTQKSTSQEIVPRDFIEMMEVPFLALSMRRTTPIVYENPKRGIKVRVTAHREHFLASVYDWDIIVFVASKMQEILNSGSDIPPRTMTFQRHEILKALHKFDERKQQKDLEKSLSRLKATLIETTIRNEDFRYKAGFGFLDSWGYTERKDVKEIEITLSKWLYDGICSKGALLRVSSEYFDLTSGIKRFLYRTARKHVGQNGDAWEFSVEKLYEKSGSEQDIYGFKRDLKTAVQANDLPEYDLRWIDRNKGSFVSFKKRKETILLEESD